MEWFGLLIVLVELGEGIEEDAWSSEVIFTKIKSSLWSRFPSKIQILIFMWIRIKIGKWLKPHIR